jgi:hypothetical protein
MTDSTKLIQLMQQIRPNGIKTRRQNWTRELLWLPVRGNPP